MRRWHVRWPSAGRRDQATSLGGVAHCREFHKGERETLCLLRTSAEGLCLMESSNLRRERERGKEGERERIT